MTTFLDPAAAMRPGESPRQARPSRAPHHGLLSPRSWAELLYTLVDLAPAIAFFALIVTLLSVGLGLMIVYVGVPIFAVGLLVARFGGQVQRAMALALLDLPTSPPGAIRPRKPGPIGAVVGVLADGACWRAVCYFVIKIALAPVTFGMTLGFYAAGLGAVSYPIWRPYLPEQAASDRSLHRGTQWWPDYFVDTWPRMVFLAIIALGVLWLAPRVVRFLTTIDRILIVSLLTGGTSRRSLATERVPMAVLAASPGSHPTGRRSVPSQSRISHGGPHDRRTPVSRAHPAAGEHANAGRREDRNRGRRLPARRDGAAGVPRRRLRLDRAPSRSVAGPRLAGCRRVCAGASADVARLGYVALAADIYGAGIRPSMQDAPKVAGSFYQDPALVRVRARAGLDELRSHQLVDPARIAVIGYCFGGFVALELARSGADFAGVVTFHGALSSSAPQDAANITGKVLVLSGGSDPVVPDSQIDEFKDSVRAAPGVDWQLVSYSGAMHAFTNPDANAPGRGSAYQATADRRSWAAMRAFFDEIFG